MYEIHMALVPSPARVVMVGQNLAVAAIIRRSAAYRSRATRHINDHGQRLVPRPCGFSYMPIRLTLSLLPWHQVNKDSIKFLKQRHGLMASVARIPGGRQLLTKNFAAQAQQRQLSLAECKYYGLSPSTTESRPPFFFGFGKPAISQ